MTDDEASRVSLLIEGYPRYGFQILSRLLEGGTKGLCVTRLHPDYVVQKHSLKNVNCYWLSGCKGKDVISPRSLGQLVRILKNGTREKYTLAFLDGLEYLLLWNDIGKVMSALKEVDSALSETKGSMLVCIDPLTLEQRDLDRLYETFPRKEASELMRTAVSSGSPQISAALQENVGQTVEGLRPPRELPATP